MIKIELRQGNQVITCSSPGKAPILSRNSSLNFYNSMELLCIAIGSCIGNKLLQYCRFNDLNINDFESITVDLVHDHIFVSLQYPKELSQENINHIKLEIITCDIAQLLNNKIIVNMIENNIDTKLVRNEKLKKTSCCGG